jgi:hypothetical protein
MRMVVRTNNAASPRAKPLRASRAGRGGLVDMARPAAFPSRPSRNREGSTNGIFSETSQPGFVADSGYLNGALVCQIVPTSERFRGDRMLKEIVRSSAENDDAEPPMFWVEVWAMTPIGIWFLVAVRPAPDRLDVEAAVG